MYRLTPAGGKGQHDSTPTATITTTATTIDHNTAAHSLLLDPTCQEPLSRPAQQLSRCTAGLSPKYPPSNCCSMSTPIVHCRNRVLPTEQR